MSKQLAELLLKDKLVGSQHYQEADEAAKKGKDPILFLIEKRYLSETKLLYYLSQKFGLPSINLDKFEIPDDVIKLVSTDMVRKTMAIPIQSNRGTVVVAVCDPTNLQELQTLRFHLKMNVEAVLTSYSSFERCLQKHYSGLASAGIAIEKARQEQVKATREQTNKGGLQIELMETHNIDSGDSTNDAPVISLVNSILGECIRSGASDIHVEPYEVKFRVRLRVDGTLREILQIPLDMKRAVIARFKIMSRMDIAVTRVPQDGRIKLKAGGKEIDFRVNTLPTLFGEKIVLRQLDKSSLQLDLKKLGFEERQLEVFRKGITSPNGLVLVTGPTGSGKTTTLYSALQELNEISDNLSTVEDPVEYNLEGINQVQVQREVGLTFASALRSLLRQDPDTVLVGEIRDYETAEVAVQAALTGHLVLSTLHTNDAPSTIVRLMNMGIEPFLVTASLNTIVAQRLLRRVCAKCAEPQSIPPQKLKDLGFPDEVLGQLNIVKGKGCGVCNNLGYKGRLAIYEILDFSPKLKEMVLRGATAMELKKQAVQEGMKNLRMSALTKVAQGLTTLEEAITMTMEN